MRAITNTKNLKVNNGIVMGESQKIVGEMVNIGKVKMRKFLNPLRLCKSISLC